MTTKYEIRFGNRIIALGYVSPHPYLRDHMVASVFPITRTAASDIDAVKVRFGPISHEGFTTELAPADMIRRLVAPHIDGVATEGFTIEEVLLRGDAEV